MFLSTFFYTFLKFKFTFFAFPLKKIRKWTGQKFSITHLFQCKIIQTWETSKFQSVKTQNKNKISVQIILKCLNQLWSFNETKMNHKIYVK